jgi:hypothetical protein
MDAVIQAGWAMPQAPGRVPFGGREPAWLRAAEPGAPYLPDDRSPVDWSEASLRLQARLDVSLSDRPLASHDRSLVERYVPNASSLLPKALADQLFQASRWYETLPRGAFARAVEEVFVLDLAWSSSRLEGNPLSRKQSQAIFSLGRLIEDPRSAHDDEVRMLINHKNAVEYLVHAAPNQRFSVEFVFAVHDLLMDGLLSDRLDQGRIRSHEVEVVGAAFEPEQRPDALRAQLDLVLAKAAAIRNPVEAAFFLWVHLAYLQAFADGNKRTSRVVANLPLLLRNCAPLSFEGIDEFDYGRAMLGVYERQDFSMAADLFVHTYRRSMRKYVALLATRPRIDVRVARFRDELLRVIRAVVVERRSAAAAIAFECLEPSDAGEFGELLAERLRTLAPRHALRFDIDEPLIDSWIAAGRPH